MLQEFLVTVNQWIVGEAAIAAVGSFVWGVVSVALSPCHMASIPLIVAYVGGQQQVLRAREAGYYSMAFSSGLFVSIALVGVACALLGRMLGDVGNYWQILIGLILIWVALGMFGVEKCSMSGTMLHRLKVTGLLYIRLYCAYFGNHNDSGEGGPRNPLCLAVCNRALPAYCRGRKFRRCCQRTAGKQHVAECGELV